MNQKKARQLRILAKKERRVLKRLTKEYLTSNGKKRILSKFKELMIK